MCTDRAAPATAVVGNEEKALVNWRRIGRAVQSFGWRMTRPLTVGVRAVMIRDSEILLVKHTYQDEWYLPGGRVEKRESLDEAIRRELREELECDVAALELFGVYSNFYESKSDHVVVFRICDFELGDVQRSEIEAVEFFPIDDLPPGTSPGTRRRVDELRTGELSIHGLW